MRHTMFMGTVWLFCSLTAVMAAAGCGYRFSGNGELPGGVRRLSVGVFENHTREIGLEAWIADDLIHQFSRHAHIRLTDKSHSDGHLTGVIRSAAVTTISHASTSVASERRVRMTLDVRLTGADGRVLWTGKDIIDQEPFAVASTRTQTEQNKKSALATLSDRIAERIYYMLVDCF